jgi:type II secretion system protein D
MFSHTTQLGSNRRWQRVAALFATIIVLVSSEGSWAQTPNKPEFRPYTLKHASPTEVENALLPLLPAGSEVIADAKANRILVRGSSQAHQVAERVTSALDQQVRSASASPSAGASGAVLNTYRCEPGKAEATAAALQADFGKTPGVRIVTDTRTSQLLVLAPPAVQAQVADRLGTSPASSASSSPALAVQPSAVSPSVKPSLASAGEGGTTAASTVAATSAAMVQEISLRNSNAANIETTLATVFGSRMSKLASSTDDVARYRLTPKQGGGIDLAVNRRTNQVAIQGADAATRSFAQLIRALDTPTPSGEESTRLVPLEIARPADVQRTVQAIRASNASKRDESSPYEERIPLAGQIFRTAPKGGVEKPVKPDTTLAQAPGGPMGPPPPAAKPEGEGDDRGGLVGPVQIEHMEGLDVLVVRGRRRDVQQVVDIIKQIEKLSAETEPAIEVLALAHVDCGELAKLILQLYDQVFATRQGSVSINALIKPNALLLIGRKESVDRVVDLVKRLDMPVSPESQFQVFRMKHASASSASSLVQGFYTDRGGLGPVVRVTSDSRSNALIIQASPRDMAEVAAMVARIDTPTSDSVNELRLFQLNHTLADDMVSVLRDAIQSQASSDSTSTSQSRGPTASQGAAGGSQTRNSTSSGNSSSSSSAARAAMLQFLTVDVRGQHKINSGILNDVRFTSDPRANTILVAAPTESMGLIEALIKQLDQPPTMRSEIKVFTIVKSDATALANMLNNLLSQSSSGSSQSPATTSSTSSQSSSSIIPLRLAVDERTNSIIAAGSTGDLTVVEAIILRLDSNDAQARKSIVYRLKNIPATEVSNSISQFLQADRQLQQAYSSSRPFELIEREVIVVPEVVTNSLIVSATPRFFDEINRIVEQLDQRPPMVVIQVLIAEVTLSDNEEFGVELGLQDSMLFNRSSTVTDSALGNILSPGFNFNNSTVGNSSSTASTATAGSVAGQGLSNLGVGRTNGNLGFGGLVLSASSESVNILLRALKQCQRLEVLSRPQITTLNNQTAYIQVGQTVPMISGVSMTNYGQTNNVEFKDVGVILRVTPRISPDNLVVMEIDANRSDVGAESEGIPISVSSSGQVIRSPRINTTLAQTTISAVNGQTVMLGGLISKNKTETHNRVPYLSDIPVLGVLFRYDATTNRRSELLIVMTPHIAQNEEDQERIKRVEAARMHWCLSDVVAIHGDGGLRGRKDDWTDGETQVIHPDQKPEIRKSQKSQPDSQEPTFAPEPQPDSSAKKNGSRPSFLRNSRDNAGTARNASPKPANRGPQIEPSQAGPQLGTAAYSNNASGPVAQAVWKTSDGAAANGEPGTAYASQQNATPYPVQPAAAMQVQENRAGESTYDASPEGETPRYANPLR